MSRTVEQASKREGRYLGGVAALASSVSPRAGRGGSRGSARAESQLRFAVRGAALVEQLPVCCRARLLPAKRPPEAHQYCDGRPWGCGQSARSSGAGETLRAGGNRYSASHLPASGDHCVSLSGSS